MKNDELFRKIVPAQMRRLMRDFQCTEYDAAAVFGNAGHESGGFRLLQEIKPTVPGSRGGLGYFQWTGPRRVNFERYCARNGLQVADPEANYKFLFVELVGPESGAMNRVKNARTLKDANDLRAKVEAFEQAFERSGVKHYDSRYDWAVVALDAYRKAEATIPEPPDVEAALPDAEQPSWLDRLLAMIRRA